MYRRRPLRSLPSLSVLAVAAALALQACDEPAPSGPELPIDGSWELVGIFSDTVGFARCWLSGRLDVARVGGGVNTVEGEGIRSLDCNIFGGQEVWADTASLENARYQGTNFSLTLGDCSFGATYLPTESSIMTGTAVCRIYPSTLGGTDVIGSWEGHRLPEASP